MTYDPFYVSTSEAISKKRRSFHWLSCNSKLEAAWISLIGRTHKTSTIHGAATASHLEACWLLAENMIEKNPGTNYGCNWTPLHDAAQKNQKEKIPRDQCDSISEKIVLQGLYLK